MKGGFVYPDSQKTVALSEISLLVANTIKTILFRPLTPTLNSFNFNHNFICLRNLTPPIYNFAYTHTSLFICSPNLALGLIFNNFFDEFTLFCSSSATNPTTLFTISHRPETPQPHNSLFKIAFTTILMVMSDGWGVGGDCTSGYGNFPAIKGMLNGSHAASCGVKTSVQHLGCGIFSGPVGSAHADSPSHLLNIHKPNLNLLLIRKIYP